MNLSVVMKHDDNHCRQHWIRSSSSLRQTTEKSALLESAALVPEVMR